MMTVRESNFCPVCGEEIPFNRKFCSDLHERLFHYAWEIYFGEYADEKEIERLTREEKKPGYF